MSEERPPIKVTIFGSDYTIRGEADHDYIQKLASYVDSRMKEIGQGTNLNNPLKISILAAINLADEIFRLRSRKQSKPSDASSNQEELLATGSIAPEVIKALAAHIEAALQEELPAEE